MQYSRTWGVGGSHTKDVTLNVTSSASIPVNPGKTASINLTASQGTLIIEITYRLSLVGAVVAVYNRILNGHHIWSVGIKGMMAKGGIQQTWDTTETIQIGYYTIGKLVIKNPA